MRIAYTVECQFGSFFGVPTWVDLTHRVNNTLTINRGRDNEFGTVRSGQFIVALDNDDGALTPNNASSPYYPYVVRGTPIRVTASTIDKNYVENPGLTTTINPWVTFDPVNSLTLAVPTVAGGPDPGTYAGKIVHSTQSNPFGAGAKITARGFIIGREYTASCYVKSDANKPTQILIFGSTLGGASSGTDWQRITATFTATSGTHDLAITTGTTTSGQVVWFDAFQIEEGSTATTYDPLGAYTSRRFTGSVYEWGLSWDNGSYGTMQISANDSFRRAGQKGELRSFLIEESLLDSPNAFLPLNEGSGATLAGNIGSLASSGVIMQRGGGGTYDFGSGTGPPADGSSALVLTPASSTSGYFIRVPIFTFSTALSFECWINSTIASSTIADLSQSFVGDAYAGQQQTLSIDAAKKLQFKSDGAALTVTSPLVVADGQTHHVAFVYEQTGTIHKATIYVDGSQVATGNIAFAWALINQKWLQIGGAFKLPLFTGTINNVGVYDHVLTADRISAHFHAGWDGFQGERSDQRVSRFASYLNLNSLTPELRPGFWFLGNSTFGALGSTTILADSDLDLQKGKAVVYGQAEGGSSALEQMLAVGVTEGGIIYTLRNGRLALLNRAHRYNRPKGMTLDASVEAIGSGIEIALDDENFANEITGELLDGSRIRVIDPVSVDALGSYGESVSLLTPSAEDAYQAATWMLANRNTIKPRAKQITVSVYDLPETYYRQLMDMDISTSFSIIGLPSPPAPTASLDLFVEGYVERANPDSVIFEINASPADNYDVWKLGDNIFGILGTSTRLAW